MCVCVCVCARTLRIVSMDKNLHFIKTSIIIIITILLSALQSVATVLSDDGDLPLILLYF